MCGRYSLTHPEAIREAFPQFRFGEFSEHRLPRFNIAPTQSVLGVRNTGCALIEPLRWGLLRAGSAGVGLINARAETLSSKPAFRDAVARRRCVVFADGFYEWKNRRPFRFTLEDGAIFAFAGLWEPRGDEPPTCAIVTCEPNDLVAKVHDRMPAILAPRDVDRWLSGDALPWDAARPMLAPYDGARMQVRGVSMRLNDASCERPEVLNDDAPLQMTLGT